MKRLKRIRSGVAAVVVLMVAALATTLPLAGVAVADETTERAPAEAQIVFILDNIDPDFRNPPFNDVLSIIDANTHEILNTIGGFNICETIGGKRTIVTHIDGSVIVAENVADRLSRWDALGSRIFSIDMPIDVIDVSRDGHIYALTCNGTIYGAKVLILDEYGNVIKEAPFGGFDIVVDDIHNSVWIVGADIKRLDKNLTLSFSIDPIEWCAVSVDFTSTGAAWVAERKHSQIRGSKNRLLKISSKGEILQSIDLDSSPFCLRVDRTDDSIWVATRRDLYKFSSDGTRIIEIDSGGWSIEVDYSDGSVWLAGRGNVRHYTKDGTLISSISGFSSSNAYVALQPWPRELLVEALKQIEQATTAIEATIAEGLDMDDAEDLLRQAEGAIAARDFGRAKTLAKQAEAKVAGIRRAAAVEQIDQAKEATRAAELRGLNVAMAEGLLSDAEQAFAARDYGKAISLAEHAKATAETIKRDGEAAIEGIEQAREAIRVAELRGFNVAVAEALLSDAEGAFAAGDYGKAISLAEHAVTTAEGIKRDGELAIEGIEQAREAIRVAELRGLNVAMAEALLSDSEEAFEDADYKTAFEMATRAKSLAMDLDQDGVVNYRDFAPTINNNHIYMGTLAFAVSLSIGIFSYGRKKKAEKEKIESKKRAILAMIDKVVN